MPQPSTLLSLEGVSAGSEGVSAGRGRLTDAPLTPIRESNLRSQLLPPVEHLELVTIIHQWNKCLYLWYFFSSLFFFKSPSCSKEKVHFNQAPIQLCQNPVKGLTLLMVFPLCSIRDIKN